MKTYKRYILNRKALPYQFQILEISYRSPDLIGFQSARAIVSIGWSRPKRKLVFNFRRPQI